MVTGPASACLSVAEGGTALLDLTGLDTSPQSPPSFPEFPTPTDSLNAPSHEIGIGLLDDELMSLGNERVRAFVAADSEDAFEFLCVFVRQD